MYSKSSEDSKKHAERHNLIVHPADNNELQIDLDTSEQEEHYRKILPSVADVYDIKDIVETPSKSGKLHARIFLAYPLSIEERIALQAILGSDPKKELCSLRNWLKGDEMPILLFEKPEVSEELNKRKD